MATAVELTRAHGLPDFWQQRNFPPDEIGDTEPVAHANPYEHITDEARLAAEGIEDLHQATLRHFCMAAKLARWQEMPRPFKGRQDAFREFALKFKLSYGLGKQYIRLYNAIPPDFWDRYKDLSWELLLEIERAAKAGGDTVEERRARILGACEQALTREMSEAGARVTARELVDADREAKGLTAQDQTLSDVGRDSADGTENDGPAETPAPRTRVRASVSDSDGGPLASLDGVVEREPDRASIIREEIRDFLMTDRTREALVKFFRKRWSDLGTPQLTADAVVDSFFPAHLGLDR